MLDNYAARVPEAVRVSGRPSLGAGVAWASHTRGGIGSRNPDSQSVRLCERDKKRLSCLQIARVEPFGEAVVDRLEECHPLRGTPLIAPQPGEARGGTQFQRQSALPPRPVERLPEVILGCGRRSGCRL